MTNKTDTRCISLLSTPSHRSVSELKVGSGLLIFEHHVIVSLASHLGSGDVALDGRALDGRHTLVLRPVIRVLLVEMDEHNSREKIHERFERLIVERDEVS